jgi:hypothetical protein
MSWVKRVAVDEDEAAHALLAGKNTTLDGSTVSDSFVGVDTLVGSLAKELVGRRL